MTRLALLAGGFGYMVLLIETVRALHEWWRGDASPGPWHWAALALAPVLGWIWWRHLSVFRPGAACATPPAEPGGGPQEQLTGNCRTREISPGDTRAPRATASTPAASASRRARP